MSVARDALAHALTPSAPTARGGRYFRRTATTRGISCRRNRAGRPGRTLRTLPRRMSSRGRTHSPVGTCRRFRRWRKPRAALRGTRPATSTATACGRRTTAARETRRRGGFEPPIELWREVAICILGGRDEPAPLLPPCALAMVTAFSTAPSNAVLPTTLRVAGEELLLPKHVSRFVLTVGAKMNRNGSALFEGVTVLFLGQLWGVNLSLGQAGGWKRPARSVWTESSRGLLNVCGCTALAIYNMHVIHDHRSAGRRPAGRGGSGTGS